MRASTLEEFVTSTARTTLGDSPCRALIHPGSRCSATVRDAATRSPEPSAATTAATPSIMAPAAASTRRPSSVICCPAGVSLVRPPALQKGDAEAAFQLAHAHPHSGLRHTVADGGLAEAAQLSHGVQELQDEQIRRRWRQHALTVT